MSGKDRGTVGRSDEDAEDVRLMQLVSGGDTGAFEELIEKHQSLVAGTVARMLGSNSDVEDIAQQVFIRVWKSARRYVPRAKFTTWLLKITRNLVFNELRRSKRRGHVPLQSGPGAADHHPLKAETNPTPDTPDLGVMREHMNTSVASTEKCAEQPAHDGNYDRAKKRAPEAGNLKTWQDLADEFQHQRIDDQNEHAQRNENQRQA